MSAIRFEVELCHPHAQAPSQRSPDDAGWDLYLPTDLHIEPMDQALVGLGIKVQFSPLWVGLIQDRSSVALAPHNSVVHRGRGCHVVAGVIEGNYPDEWKVALWNLSDQPAGFAAGERVAQLLLLPRVTGVAPRVVPRIERAGTARPGGFGSSGR